MKTFCTIVTNNYLPYAIALYKSLRRFNKDIRLQVLVTDAVTIAERSDLYPGMTIIPAADLMSFHLTAELYKKYAHTSKDNFRWALKPVFIRYLLDRQFTRILYTDCDIFFYADYEFLFEELDRSSVLLTPHWRNPDPLTDEPSFLSLFTDGIFNAGFIGVSNEGIAAMDWWAKACHYRMETNQCLGLREDQGYLDLMPVQFENVKIIRHRGCNISAWNQLECRRVNVNGEILINGIYPVVFIHFNEKQFSEILQGHDKLLLPHMEEFKRTFEEEGIQLQLFYKNIDFYYKPGILLKLKWKLLIRTRIKRMLFLLAQKL